MAHSLNTGAIKKMVQTAHAKQGLPEKEVMPPMASGTVHRIEQSADHPGVARVSIKHGQPGKVGKGGQNLGFDNRPESTAHVHVDDASKLKIGQKVHVRVHDGEYGAMTGDEATE
jgi:sRNA-binding protein